ncbi:MAG TPA: hypothetical protein PK079_20890 [Leptospiraceae bacterium]|nr:hypothetical protein [Leptospiraceae bacterium]HMW08081.1 hypothetical protein [Leptospiraceae bacterium]HMX34844.1 hypothetical protein [Leptospiraceae bacterium]HMY33793.1 hypothetical protein [Leptospiraceae bacterium]HMZ67177.1 hypothetical protein [Leptospiraceae bacterium]
MREWAYKRAGCKVCDIRCNYEEWKNRKYAVRGHITIVYRLMKYIKHQEKLPRRILYDWHSVEDNVYRGYLN